MCRQFIVPQEGVIEYVIGIDFGHGETSAAISRVDSKDDPEDIVFAGSKQKTIPSAIFIHEDPNGEETVYIGDHAVAEYGKGEGNRFDAYFKESPDSLDEDNNPKISLMKKFMWEVYKTICLRRSGELMEGDRIKNNHVVFIACPSESQKWGENAMKNYVQLALDAGLPIAGAAVNNKYFLSGIVRESRAAYIRALQKHEVSLKASEGILVIDFGSSTIDMTYYKKGEKPVDKGYSIGASSVEERIYEYLKHDHPELGRGQNPHALQEIELNHPSIKTSCVFSMRKAKESFYTGYEYANEMEVQFKFRPLSNEKLDVDISKDNLENIILPDYIRLVNDAFEDFKTEVIQKSPVTLLVLTGGASQMNFVERIAKSVFGENVQLLPPQDPSLTVSNGIATAGRADINLYYLSKNLFSDPTVANPTIIDGVIEDASTCIAEEVIRDMLSYYESFKNQISQESVAELKKRISSSLKSSNNSYINRINTSFQTKLKYYIQNTIVDKTLKKYIEKYFPYFDFGQIKSKELGTLNVEISDSTLSTLNTAMENSVKQIEDSALIEAVKIIWDIVALLLSAIAKFEAEIIARARNVGKYVWDEIKGNAHKESDKWKAPTYDDILNDLVAEINDENTKLDKTKREKVYKAFNDNKSSYQNTLKSSILNKFKYDSDLRNKINEASKTSVAQYAIEEITDIQRLIK